MRQRVGRRTLVRGMVGSVIAGAGMRQAVAQTPSPAASPAAAEWSFTDVTGVTVTLPERPQRIAAYINQAASLWDFGIEVVAVFGWTAANNPDGDHIAWGNVEPGAVAQISDGEGNVELEQLVAAAPDLIVTWTWNKDDVANATNGFLPEVLEQAREIAPIVVLNQGDPSDVELGRVEALAKTLGVDLQAPALVEARLGYEGKLAEFAETVAAKPEISAIFASYGEPGTYYVGAPDYVADLGFLRSHGLQLANDGAPGATAYWETLSTEQSLLYPCDIIYLDTYGAWNTLEQVQQEPAIVAHPAIAAGQVGTWQRDFPLSYAGLTGFLEDVLTPFRTAGDVG